MDEQSYFKPLTYQARLSKYAANAYYIDLAGRNGNLRDSLVRTRTIHSKQFVLEQQFDDRQFWNSEITDDQLKAEIEKIYQGLAEQDKKEVDGLFLTYFNMSLVMICSVFEDFLVDCMDVVVSHNPNIRSQRKRLEKFEYWGLEDKLKTFGELGAGEQKLFTLNEKASKKYPKPVSFLKEIYARRKNIVHKNLIELKGYEELSQINEFMLHMIIKWGGIVFPKHFGIKSDISLVYQGEVNPQDLGFD
jgi:hypothetical protein